MQTILIPTDFSAQAANAAVHAAELAKAFNGKLLLFHAYMLPTPVSEVPYVMVTVDELQKENEQMIRREAEALNQRFDIEVEWLVRIGIPSDEIKILSEERRIDLVVMGMKGVGGLDKLIGSTTVNLIRKIKTPVMVIPQDAPFKPLTNIAFATDLHYEMNAAAFQPVALLAKQFGSSIQVVHVKTENNGDAGQEIEWRNNAENMWHGLNYEFITVTDTNVKHGIVEYIETHHTDLLVMLAHRHGFIERLFNRSQTAAMAYETKVPMLALHD